MVCAREFVGKRAMELTRMSQKVCTFALDMKCPNTIKSPQKSVERLLKSGLSFALFRFPKETTIHLILQTEGETRLLSPGEKEPRGFIFAPFQECSQCPTLLIEPQIMAQGWEAIGMATRQLPKRKVSLANPHVRHAESRYKEFFRQSKEAIQRKEVEKIVAADKQTERGRYHLKGREAELFCKAVEGFSNSMVSLVYTPQSGRWMGITPEVLLKGGNGMFHTMVLAGTKKDEETEWDRKNQMEHQTVVRYLEETFRQGGIPFTKGTRYTRRAGHLFHLCTEFSLSPTPAYHTSDLIRLIHPTPAVCGMPQENALRLILSKEKCERNYYSGYLGPINMPEGTHIYVNLRCANIHRYKTLYYGGGGLNQFSELEKEQQEILHKINVLKQLADD